jgi:hypothetical protein
MFAMAKPEELALSAYSRATGGQFLAFFGVFWLAGSLLLPQQFPRDPRVSLFNVLAFAVGAVVATVVFFQCRRTKRSTRALALAPGNSHTQARRSRLFRIINAGQYLALGAAALFLMSIHRIDLLIPTGVFIIGAHFLPLALLFKYPFHLMTSSLLMAWAIAYPQCLDSGGWNPLGLSVTGIILLLAACWSNHTAAQLATDAVTPAPDER